MSSRQTGSLRIAVAGALVAIVAGAPAARAQAAAKLDDPTIVAIFDAANTWDIQTGQLAAKKGTTKAVKDFGAMLVRDHTTVRQQGRDLATKLKVTPTPPKDFALAKTHADAMKKLEGLSGAEFDNALLQNEVDYHQAVIDAVTSTLLPSLQNAEVKDLVTKVAPAFAAHRDAAKNLLTKGE
jgi:putative membrane protein